MDQQYYVYILTNPHRTVFYTGVTNDLIRRVSQHRSRSEPSFTTRYNCGRLVFYELFRDSYNAITREKQLKAGSRRRNIELIERMNPNWKDLYEAITRDDSVSIRGIATRADARSR
jgi:putative endonuclease